jgi:hypothetical protein
MAEPLPRLDPAGRIAPRSGDRCKRSTAPCNSICQSSWARQSPSCCANGPHRRAGGKEETVGRKGKPPSSRPEMAPSRRKVTVSKTRRRVWFARSTITDVEMIVGQQDRRIAMENSPGGTTTARDYSGKGIFNTRPALNTPTVPEDDVCVPPSTWRPSWA